MRLFLTPKHVVLIRKLHCELPLLLHMLMSEYNLLQGDVSVELYWNHAPKTCRNFAELVSIYLVKGRPNTSVHFAQARSGYYNGCKFHRIIKVL